MYDGDSFFTLSTLGQIGLIILSLVLAGLCMAAIWYFARGIYGLVLAIALFWLFMWLSPQIYYSYYLTLFDGLPLQWVINPIPLRDVIALFSFTGPSNLAAHGQGVFGWLLIAISLWRWRR